jgi:hypothetical protein
VGARASWWSRRPRLYAQQAVAGGHIKTVTGTARSSRTHGHDAAKRATAIYATDSLQDRRRTAPSASR